MGMNQGCVWSHFTVVVDVLIDLVKEKVLSEMVYGEVMKVKQLWT